MNAIKKQKSTLGIFSGSHARTGSVLDPGTGCSCSEAMADSGARRGLEMTLISYTRASRDTFASSNTSLNR